MAGLRAWQRAAIFGARPAKGRGERRSGGGGGEVLGLGGERVADHGQVTTRDYTYGGQSRADGSVVATGHQQANQLTTFIKTPPAGGTVTK